MQQDEVEYVGFWARVGASIIDTILVAAVVFPLMILIFGWEYFVQLWSLMTLDHANALQMARRLEQLSAGIGPIGGLAGTLVRWVLPGVAVVLFWLYRDATPGKMAIAARVVDAQTGKSMSPGQSIGRYFAYLVSFLPLCLGFVWVAADGRKQGWHDKLAGTVVIKSK